MDDSQHCHECDCGKSVRGPRGFRGPRGYDGLDGMQGPKGNEGPRGPRGFQGYEGEKGEKGDKGDPGSNGAKGDTGPRGSQGPKGEQGPPGIFETAYGFTYTEFGSADSGIVKFIIASPVEYVELVSDGLQVLKDGIYQIHYKVQLESKAITCIPSKFHIEINNEIKIVSSMTESTTASTLTSTQLFSLQEGDVVKLIAELQEHFSYKLATLQVLQVG